MSQRNWLTSVTVRLSAALLILAGASASFATDPEPSSEAARLATYKNGSETSFALSLRPKVKPDLSTANDLLILFDTSASQSGLYRKDALTALNRFLAQLNPKDQVKLVAVDVNSTDLHREFVAPQNAQIAAGLKKLGQRVPLGSTDMLIAMKKALDSFTNLQSNSPRHVIYIGDGMSKANLIDSDEFAEAVTGLAQQKISFSSYAIGPNMDIALLAAIANQTGGNIIVDSDEAGITDRAANYLLATARAKVYWPEKVILPKEIVETYPANIPPLRSDRDVVLVGKLSSPGEFNISCEVQVDGKKIELNWPVKSEKSNSEFAFLPQLVEQARADAGITLPTLGSEGLRETGRMILASSNNLTKLARQAKARGATKEAQTLATAALKNDPENIGALILGKAVKTSTPAQPSPTLILQDQELEDQDGVVQTIEITQEQIAGRIRAELKREMKIARDIMSSSPQDAIQRLKLALETVDNSADLDADSKAQLREGIDSALKQAQAKSIEIGEKEAEQQRNLATAREKANLEEDSTRTKQKLSQLMAQFKSLIDEEKYVLAYKNIAPEIEKEARGTQLQEVSEFYSEFSYNNNLNREKRELRHRKFIAAILSVEESAIPFDDRDAILYPDKEFWERITREREKYKAVDLLKPDGPEAKINAALDQVADYDFVDTPLKDAMDVISADHGIPVAIDKTAIEDAGFDEDLPLTGRANKRTLRAAMRSLFREYDFTYVIIDEELLITTREAITNNPEKYLTTKVYNVGDLVVPIMSGMGGMMGGMGGGMMGGGMGGGMMGGGMGGMGGRGGMGGGGFGGGGRGGGLFFIQDETQIGTKKKGPVSKIQARFETTPVIKVEIKKGETAIDAWDNYFKETHADPSRIAQTAERMAKYERYEELVAMILGALRNNQGRPWMYQGLAVAMEANGSPKTEIERALLSASDFGAGADELMIAAVQMTRLGLDQSALKIFKDVAQANPTRHEPYVLALKTAKKLNATEAIQWATCGILSQEWPMKHRHIREEALVSARAQMIKMARAKQTQALEKYKKELSQSMVRDCVIKVTWTGTADVDIMVEEPSGTICSLRNQRTASGGVFIGDEFAKKNEKSIDGFSEYYVLPRGFKGDYRLAINKIYGEIASGKVTVEIARQVMLKSQSYQKKQIDLDENGQALVLFSLQSGRRTDHLGQHQIAVAAEEQFAVNRSILANKISKYDSSEAAREYAKYERKKAKDGLTPINNRRRDAGFRPQITTLPSGAGASVTAVVSADRRYVRITPIPMFSSIASVSTFTFSGGGGGQGGGGGGGGFGGGGGGFGGGGGGFGGGGGGFF